MHQSESSSQVNAIPSFSWIYLIDLFEHLEIILQDPAQLTPPAYQALLEVPLPPLGVAAHEAAEDFVNAYNASGVKTSPTQSEIDDALDDCADIIMILNAEPGILESTLDTAVRQAVSDVEDDLGA